MKKGNTSLKDYVYDSMDYLIVLVIVIFVVSIISWRLDILFNSSNTMDSIQLAENKVSREKDENKNEIEEKQELNLAKNSKPIDLAKKEKSDENQLEKATRNKPIEKEKTVQKAKTNEINKIDTPVAKTEVTNEVVKVNIPKGSDSNSIANILASSGLISDTGKFLDQCESMGLSTKLKAGDFSIPKDSSLENVITTITK